MSNEAAAAAERLLAGPLGRAFVAHLCGIDLSRYVVPRTPGVRYRAADGGARAADGGTAVRPGGRCAAGPDGPEASGPAEFGAAAGEAAGAPGEAPDASARRPWPAPEPGPLRRRLDRTSAAELLAELGALMEDFAFGGYEQWREAAGDGTLPWDTLAPAARTVAEHPAAAWWWSPSPDPQVLIGDLPLGGDPAAALEAADDTARDVWWTQPSQPGIPCTCGTVPGTGTPTSTLCHDDQPPEEDAARHTPVTVTPRDLFVVNGPEEWTGLVAAHPRRLLEPPPAWSDWTGLPGPWLVPDWRSVAAAHDGVLVTLGGYLAAAYRPLPTGSGVTMLAGWNAGETVWLDGGRALTPAP